MYVAWKSGQMPGSSRYGSIPGNGLGIAHPSVAPIGSSRRDYRLSDPGLQDRWDADRAVGLLVVFQQRDQAAADGDRGAVEGVGEDRAFLARLAVADAET